MGRRTSVPDRPSPACTRPSPACTRPPTSRLTAAVAPRLRPGALPRDRPPVVEDERGDHGHAQDGEQEAQEGSGGDPGEGKPEAPADRSRTGGINCGAEQPVT